MISQPQPLHSVTLSPVLQFSDHDLIFACHSAYSCPTVVAPHGLCCSQLARLELVVRGPAALAAPTATPPTGITKRTETISTSPKADPYDTQLGEANTLKDMSASKEDGRRGGGRGSWLGRKAKSAPAVISGSRKAGKLQHGGGGGCGRSDDGHMSMSPRAAALQPAWDAIDHASLEAVAAELAGPEAVKVSVDAGVAGVVALFGSLERAACASAEDVASVYGSVAQQWGAEVMAGGADGDGAATLCRAQGRRNVHVSSAGGTRRGHKAQHTSNDAAHSSAAATAPTGRDACMSLLAALPMLHALNPGALSVMGCSLVPGALVDVHTHWHEVRGLCSGGHVGWCGFVGRVAFLLACPADMLWCLVLSQH